MSSSAKNNDPSGLPIAPSMEPALESTRLPAQYAAFGKRSVIISLLSILIGILAGIIARALTGLIGLITNISFYGKLSFDFISPAYNHLGLFVIIVPVLGAVVIGIMARYGSTGIRGHGIPEAMEQVILNESRIPARLTFLKPVSAAISIGTGGPFGAEGPIIATGGALGSLIGQLFILQLLKEKYFLQLERLQVWQQLLVHRFHLFYWLWNCFYLNLNLNR